MSREGHRHISSALMRMGYSRLIEHNLFDHSTCSSSTIYVGTQREHHTSSTDGHNSSVFVTEPSTNNFDIKEWKRIRSECQLRLLQSSLR